MKRLLISACALALASCGSAAKQDSILIEAENFDQTGGWLLDVQAFPKICSSYIIAHGMGTPVDDASTKVTITEPGIYKVYASTYNWTSPWYDGKGPGSFQLMVNGTALENTLGNSGKEWEWQLAGEVELSGEATITLHDLTGFNGRVDAIYLTKGDEAPVAPTTITESRAWRAEILGQETKVAPKHEFIVVGGGVAGCTTALTAARLGTDVALIHNLPILGGNNTPGGGHMSGKLTVNLYPKVGNILREITGIPIPEDSHKEEYVHRDIAGHGLPSKGGNDQETSDLRLKIFNSEENLDLYASTYVIDATMDGDKIVSVLGKDVITGQETIFEATTFADCTGDGNLGYLAGADFHIGREDRAFANEPTAPLVADNRTLGTTLKWGARNTGKPTVFPNIEDMPWAMQCSDDYHVKVSRSSWQWETGFEIDNALEPELVRDNMLRAVFGNWGYVKNHYDEYKNFQITTMNHNSLKRESRRLMGDVILNENDITNQVEYPDASFTATWSMDLHYPTPENTKYFKGWEWQAFCEQPSIEPYHVPYRVLYSRNIDNLFVGGRCMSVTHIALGSVRVIGTLAMAGEVAGMAANICRIHGTTPRGVYENHLEELKAAMTKGTPTKPNELQLIPGTAK